MDSVFLIRPRIATSSATAGATVVCAAGAGAEIWLAAEGYQMVVSPVMSGALSASVSTGTSIALDKADPALLDILKTCTGRETSVYIKLYIYI
jgi:hypothetical protein